MSVPVRPPAEVPHPPRPRPVAVRPEVGLWLAVGCVYVLAGLIGLGLAGLSPGVSVLWPPSGVALAALVRLGWRALPGVAVGALVVNLINARPDAPLWGAFGITAGNVAGAALGGWLATRGKRLRLDHLGGVGVLVLAAVLGSVPAALLGAAFVAAVGGDAPGDLLMTAVVWWTGDMAGVLLFVPLLLWPPVVAQDGSRGAVAWAGLLASAAFAAGFALTPGVPDPASLMACLPVVAIAAARYGPRGAAVANFVTAAVVIALLVADHKAMGERLALVGFLAVSVVTALCLGIVTAERDAAETALSADIAARVAAEAQKARAEAALAADRSRFATLLAHSHDALVVMTRDGRTAYVTDAITEMSGRTPAELTGRSTFENVHPDDRTLVQLTFADTLAHPGLPTKAEFRIQRTDGRWVWLEALATNHLDNPAVAGVVVNIRDVTDLAAHLAAHPHLAAAAIGMIRVRNVNQAAVAMNRAADKAELMASLSKLIGPETGAAFARELVGLWNGDRALRIETRAVRLTGEPADIVLHVGVPNAGGRPDLSRVVVLAVDVTDQKRLEEQFRQAQKLEAVARLAGGIAHDFNNLLTVINGFSELIAAETPAGSPLRPLVTHIQSAGERGADLTRQLLAFSRKQPPTAGPVDLAAVVESLRPLLAPLIGEEVTLVTRVAAVPKVLADRGQMESVVMNLCVNARDAMPAGGTLTVETGVAEVTEVQSPDDPPPGRWVVLSVSDTGTGIPEEVRPHLFEPFFTTKELGKGTGLGLSTVYGIAATAGGHIRFTTATDCGTTFHIYLPTAGAAAGYFPPPGRDTGPRPRAADAPPPPPRVAAFADAPLVLLVEDQPAIRELSARVLGETGFEVIAAGDGIEALSVLADLSRPPAVLVTDVRMPNLTGRDLADRVRLKHPEIKVLFISGDTEEVSGPNEAFLAKPFNIDELTDAVIAVLGAPVPQPAAG
jgi:PAS domain S-box-containing protein